MIISLERTRLPRHPFNLSFLVKFSYSQVVMPPRRSARQPARQEAMAQDEEPNMDHNTNGHAMNGYPKGPEQDLVEESEKTQENIFLFVPNLIGMRCPHTLQVRTHADTVHWYRLHPHRPRPRISVLHATAPAPLQLPLLRLLPPRRHGRLGCAQVPAIHSLRRGARYDHRSLHHHLLARLPFHREAGLLHDLPSTD